MNEDEMDRLLRRSDPAAGLPPLDADRLHRLTDQARVAGRAPRAVGRRPPVPGRWSVRRLVLGTATGLAGAAAAAAVAVPLALSPAASSTLALRTPAATGPAAICAPVSADTVARADVAFLGTVTSVRDDLVTLRVDHRYAGEAVDVVTVPQGAPSGLDGAAPVFDDGRSYLVAAVERTVLTCGSTGTDSPDLRAVYDRAFDR